MYCKNCGNTIENESKFCKECGANVQLGKAGNCCKNCGSNNVSIIEETYHMSIVKETINAILKIASFVLLFIGAIFLIKEPVRYINAQEYEILFTDTTLAISISGIVVFCVSILFNAICKIILGSSKTKLVCMDCKKSSYLKNRKDNI